MANRTAWTAGNGAGFTFTSIFATSDLTSLANGSCVLSSGTVFLNQNSGNLDMFCDVSVEITISSTTPSAGAYIGLWIAALQSDGTTYGDGFLVAGTKKAYLPAWPQAGIVPIESTGATTLMAAYFQNILLPPNSFKWVLYNGTGVTFSATAANNVAKMITYNVNLNN